MYTWSQSWLEIQDTNLGFPSLWALNHHDVFQNWQERHPSFGSSPSKNKQTNNNNNRKVGEFPLCVLKSLHHKCINENTDYFWPEMLTWFWKCAIYVLSERAFLTLSFPWVVSNKGSKHKHIPVLKPKLFRSN